jgi:hypothetical protein
VKKPSIPSPTKHPNAYAVGTLGGLSAFLVTEVKLRLGFDLTMEEAAYIVAGISTLVVFLGKKT